MRGARAARGLALAAALGVAVEAIAQLVVLAGGDTAMTRAGRILRLAEVGAVAAAAGLALALAWRLVRGRAGTPAAMPVAGAAAFLLWLGVAAFWQAPDPSALRETADPILLRRGSALWGLLVAALVLPLVLWIASRLAPPRARYLGWGLAGLAAASAAAAWLAPVGGAPRPGPDLVLFSVDTLRADKLGCYGYPLPTTPALDALCREAVVFERAMAPAPSTIPSYASILSGQLQKAHGVYSNFQKAPDALDTLAEWLREAGYTTAAVIHGSFPGTFANLGQGFELVIQRGVTARTPHPLLSEAIRSLRRAAADQLAERLRLDRSVTTSAAAGWLAEVPEDTAVFAHFYWPYPHDPYLPPDAYLTEELRDDTVDPEVADAHHRYNAEVRYTDRQVGRLLELLQREGRYEDAWIVFTADHGEELGRFVTTPEGRRERFFGHSRYLYDTSIRVPLIVKPPRGVGIAPRREPAVVSIARVAATLLQAAGVDRPDSLLPPLPVSDSEAAREDDEAAFSVIRSPIDPIEVLSIRTRDWRLVETRRPRPRVELYRHEDGEESEDLVDAHPGVARSLLERLHAFDPPDADPQLRRDDLKLSEEERRRLEALGYAF